MRWKDLVFLLPLCLLLSSCEEPEHVSGRKMNIFHTDSFADVLLYVNAVNEHGVESLVLPLDHAPEYCPEGYSGPTFEVRIGIDDADEDAPLWEYALLKGQEIRLEYYWFIGVLAFYEDLDGRSDPCVVTVRSDFFLPEIPLEFQNVPPGEEGDRLQEAWEDALLSPVPSPR